MAAGKVSPDLLVKQDGELGIVKADKFETLLNFDFKVAVKVGVELFIDYSWQARRQGIYEWPVSMFIFFCTAVLT